MSGYSPTLEFLIEKFRSLPGIGGKSAVRLAFHILKSDNEYVEEFCRALKSAKSDLKICRVCQNISDTEICGICSDTRRDRGLVCVVENARDTAVFERVKEFNGVYHVLHGVISPLNGVTPDRIRIRELLNRVNPPEGASEEEFPKVREVILATDSNVEGEATAMYISKLIKPFGVLTSRLAYGIPVGAELEYADEVTLFRAIEGRREI